MDTTNQTNLLGFRETERREEFLKTRAVLMQCPDVFEVKALSWVPDECRWLWCIKTTFATWPKFVVGWLDPKTGEAEEVFQCGREDSAMGQFEELNVGDHQ